MQCGFAMIKWRANSTKQRHRPNGPKRDGRVCPVCHELCSKTTVPCAVAVTACMQTHRHEVDWILRATSTFFLFFFVVVRLPFSFHGTQELYAIFSNKHGLLGFACVFSFFLLRSATSQQRSLETLDCENCGHEVCAFAMSHSTGPAPYSPCRLSMVLHCIRRYSGWEGMVVRLGARGPTRCGCE